MTAHRIHSLRRTVLACLLLLPVFSRAQSDRKPLPVTIYSRIASDYKRELQEDGKPTPERYAIGFGGRVDGTLWDQTQVKEDFPEIAGTIAEELAKQNYFYASKKEDADLMVIIHWGRTNPANSASFGDGVNVSGQAYQALGTAVSGFESQDSGEGISLVDAQVTAIADANAQLDSALALMQMENRMQELRDEKTAKVLGYTDDLNRNNDIARHAGSDRFDLLLQDVHDPRYYVIVTAYDFQELTENTKKKKPNPRWVTRFSIRTRGNDFMASVEEMALSAGRYFGRDSGRLIRDYKGEVSIGEMQVVGTASKTAPDE
ncbi:hypothetical protein N9023_04960 [Opitutaceae bacterium]|nr:hypothetical protein [Opitutaceae bacterium]